MPQSPPDTDTGMANPETGLARRMRHRAEDRLAGATIAALLRLPYAQRVPAMGQIASRVIAPLAGYRRRIRANLAHVFPDLPADEVSRMLRAVPDNLGRALIEQFSGREFVDHVAGAKLRGPGLDAVRAAHARRHPVIFVTGHVGNYLAGMVAMRAQGLPMGGLYMPMTNPAFNHRYVAAISCFVDPAFPRGRAGLGGMLRHLRQGGMLGMLVDQDMPHGAPLDFLGKPARTALSAAELALKFDALLVPGYAIRRPDGLSFDVTVEAPVPQDSPEAMTQALNDSLGRVVRAHMDQWLWSHRRWKI